MEKTLKEYNIVFDICRDIFRKKIKDYGSSWSVLRPSSITDQIYIKISRIREIEIIGEQKISDPVIDEYIAIVNYSIISLIQLERNSLEKLNKDEDFIMNLYDEKYNLSKDLLSKKNHDYGEAWREMRISSITDLILTKVLRIKQIEDNKGKTIISEGPDSNYLDILNYSIFALIKLKDL